MRGLLIGVLLYTVGQTMIWIQTNGQFVWPWFKRNPFLISLMGGTLISYMFIHATNYLAAHFDGQLWPGRFIGQALGIITFSTLTFLFLGEGVNTKTAVCLFLAICIILIQIFWK
jgi:hypothetical protein